MVSPVFAGRKTELAALASAFDAAADGRPGTVLVGAEAGGGKSRLASEFAENVRRRALVLAGGCVDLSAVGPPYAPFTAVLRELLHQRGGAELTALLPADSARELAWLLPEFGAPPAGVDPDMARARLFGVLLALLGQLAGQQPLVLVVEDMHWADRSTRDLLAFLVRNLRHAAVLVVVTFRSDELHRTHPLRPLLAQLGRMDGVTRLELPRLSRQEVAVQLEGILGRPPEPEVADAVHERGNGIPLFTEALVNSDGTISREVPRSLQDLLLGAVKELPEQTQQVLRSAAVAGARVGHALLAAVTGLDDVALTALLRPAVAANVIVADADGYVFRHELIRAAVREDVLPGEHAQAHRAFAEALEAEPLLSTDGRVSAELATHWRGSHEDERALAAAWRAAADAEADAAYPEQLQMLELVLELWERVPGAGRITGTDHAAVVELAAGAARWAGEPDRGLSLVAGALGQLGEAEDAERRASLLLRRAALRQQRLLPGREEDLRAALRLADRPTRLRAEILSQLCAMLAMQHRHEEAERLAAELRDLAGQLGDQEYQAEAQITLADLGIHQGRDTIAALQSAREMARRIGSGRLEIRGYTVLAYALEGQGDHERAIQTGHEGLARIKQLGLADQAAAPIVANLARSLMSVGRWDEALETIESLGLNPAPFGRTYLLLLSGQIALARGDQQSAARMVHELRSRPAGALAASHVALPLAQLELECLLADGDFAGALRMADKVRELGVDDDPRYLWPLLATAMRACADIRLPSDGSDPAELRETLELQAAKLARHGPVERAHALVFAAEASRARGHSDLPAWDAAAAAWEDLGQPYPLAYALLRVASADAEGGDRDPAASRLQRAAELASQLGARPLLQQITQLARRARIELTTGTGRAATQAPYGLTGRELEVLRLVAAGYGNPKIAAELFISPKTASVHVSNILGKLGVTSRGQAAAAARRLHLFDPP